MDNSIILLSALSYETGLIGLAEYTERRAVADWLSAARGGGQPDPRGSRDGERIHQEDPEPEPTSSKKSSGSDGSSSLEEDDHDHQRFLAFNRWMFTVGDRDCYPSVPHGHLHKKTNEWPKLNPYTGRVFSDLHEEKVGCRLTKAEMKLLWNDNDFVEYCRKQVLWYSDFAQEYEFPRARFGRLRFPRWR
jgi:hypothetical protein